ncbi:MAG: Holliday junction branch migration protein RuvA [Denitrobacterium sp.]|jgi:Holliday junction DNA helicase RuvA|nr:Holliday junction branch migration protein RuvA [Denitrobacterium sp.]MCI1479879.1 Holliday junction branch migration protein RuvA [Eggerthellaceae bacterium]
MIAFLKGRLAAKTESSVVIDVGGVGYAVGMSAHSLSSMPAVGEPVQVYTYLLVREDALTLYGFANMAEKALFERLISVSGVGPKVALAALSSYTTEALSNAIIASDTTAVSRIPGIGKKTAQRIILELQGTLESASQQQDDLFAAGNAQAVKAATEDLLAMGFSSAEAEVALKGAAAGADEAALLQYALKRLGK